MIDKDNLEKTFYNLVCLIKRENLDTTLERYKKSLKPKITFV